MTISSEDAAAASELQRRLVRDGVVSAQAHWSPMSGGVSSDIFRVDDGGRTVVVKRALPRLRVQQEWMADVSRNEFEQRYLKYVGKFLPQAVPRVLSTGDGYFVMEYLGNCYASWKTLLLEGDGKRPQSAVAGSVLGRIHAHSFHEEIARRDFECPDNFRQLRIEPYLLATARVHTNVARQLNDEADRLLVAREALVHGDFSPKNLLWGENRLVVLDCEVAWYGDPAFDVAFLTSHLLLKSMVVLQQGDWARMIADFLQDYAAARGDIDVHSCDRRAARLLPMLLLARVDGKSPVEYLDARQQAAVRTLAINAIAAREEQTTQEFCLHWIGSFKAAGFV